MSAAWQAATNAVFIHKNKASVVAVMRAYQACDYSEEALNPEVELPGRLIDPR